MGGQLLDADRRFGLKHGGGLFIRRQFGNDELYKSVHALTSQPTCVWLDARIVRQRLREAGGEESHAHTTVLSCPDVRAALHVNPDVGQRSDCDGPCDYDRGDDDLPMDLPD